MASLEGSEAIEEQKACDVGGISICVHVRRVIMCNVSPQGDSLRESVKQEENVTCNEDSFNSGLI